MNLLRAFSRRALIVGAGALHAWPLAFAQDAAPRDRIVLGQSVALTGPAAGMGRAYAMGAKLAFDQFNASGGINGRRVELISIDDAGNPATTAANTKKLLEQGAFALFGFQGTPQVTAAQAVMKDSDMLLFGPMAAGDELGGSLFPSVYLMRPGYAGESAVLIRHAMTLGASKLALVHDQGAESLAGIEAAERTMGALGAHVVMKALPNAVDRISSSGAQSALVVGEVEAAAQIIRNLRARQFRGPIYAFSNTGERLLAEALGTAGSGVVVARVVPRTENMKLPLVRNLHAAAAAAQAERPNVYMLEGYVAAAAFAEALRRTGNNLTRPRLRKSIEAMNDVDIGGFRVNFEGTRSGSKLVELGVIDSQGRIRE